MTLLLFSLNFSVTVISQKNEYEKRVIDVDYAKIGLIVSACTGGAGTKSVERT